EVAVERRKRTASVPHHVNQPEHEIDAEEDRDDVDAEGQRYDDEERQHQGALENLLGDTKSPRPRGWSICASWGNRFRLKRADCPDRRDRRVAESRRLFH